MNDEVVKISNVRICQAAIVSYKQSPDGSSLIIWLRSDIYHTFEGKEAEIVAKWLDKHFTIHDVIEEAKYAK